MSVSSEILAGVSLSLSGRFRLQGQEALNGLKLWVDYAAPTVAIRLIVYDEESGSEQAQ